MSNKKVQFNINEEKIRNQVSGFVVDLRQKVDREIKQDSKITKNKIDKAKKKLTKEERKTEKEISHKANQELKQIQKSILKVKPNLLKINKDSKKPKFNRSVNHHFFKDTSLWLKFLNEQTNLFNTAAKLNIKPVKEKIAADKRVREAETKVVWYRSILSFVIVLVLIVLPLKLLSYFDIFDVNKLEAQIVNHSQSAFSNLLAATNAAGKMDFKAADFDFKNAGNDFISAQQKLNNISDSILFLAALSDNPKLKLAAESKKFLSAGAIASSLGSNLVLATDSLFASNKENFSDSLDKFVYYGESAVDDSKNLKKELDKINPKNLPDEYQDKFISLSQQTGSLSDNLENFVSAGTKLKEILGATKDKRYLLVFQNNSELRASGGFLGSYALVDIREGKIRNLEVPGGGSYDTEGGMNVRVAAPEPLWLVNPLWHFWDANWWPDWPTTAKNLMWFYEKSNGPTVDGVISITPTVVERLLEITGPIDMTKEYGLTIDSNNFWETVQKVVEQKNLASTSPEALIGIPATSTVLESTLPLKQNLDVNSANKPKKIIGDLMAKIMETLPNKLNKDNLVNILSVFEDSMAEKQVLFYFDDPILQAEVTKHNWAGEVKDTNRDYLMVVNTNIAGQKSDRKMTEKIEHSSEVSLDGSIINTVKITRTHTGTKNEPLTGVRNVDWLRVYVPQGSELLSADGFRRPDEKYFDKKPEPSWEENDLIKIENEAAVDGASGTKIYPEDNKTVFANWVMVDPGESVIITLKYRLPFNFLDSASANDWLTKFNALLNPDEASLIPYSLMVQKQPGAQPSEFHSRLALPLNWPVFWSYPENLSGANGWEINDSLNSDKYWSILIKK
jgi:hypothetical protein